MATTIGLNITIRINQMLLHPYFILIFHLPTFSFAILTLLLYSTLAIYHELFTLLLYSTLAIYHELFTLLLYSTLATYHEYYFTLFSSLLISPFQLANINMKLSAVIAIIVIAAAADKELETAF
jgi:hypothetical protein